MALYPWLSLCRNHTPATFIKKLLFRGISKFFEVSDLFFYRRWMRILDSGFNFYKSLCTSKLFFWENIKQEKYLIVKFTDFEKKIVCVWATVRVSRKLLFTHSVHSHCSAYPGRESNSYSLYGNRILSTTLCCKMQHFATKGNKRKQKGTLIAHQKRAPESIKLTGSNIVF